MDGLLSVMERLEIIGFFAGYPLIYSIVQILGSKWFQKSLFKDRWKYLLPLAYALTGLLYWGLQLRNLYPDYSIKHITEDIQHPFLKIWALLSLIFWIPFFYKKPIYSLLHSLVFFFLLIKALFLQIFIYTKDNTAIRNDMKVYSDSLLLNIFSFIVVLTIYFFLIRFGNKRDNMQKQ